MNSKYNLLISALLSHFASGSEYCEPDTIQLSTQQDIDNFQRVFGGDDNYCERVVEDLKITTDFSAPLASQILNLDGLIRLKSIGGALEVTGNDFGSASNATNSLTSIEGLANIERVGSYLLVSNNKMLSDCAPIAALLGHPNAVDSANVGWGTGGIVIANNGAGCNRVEEIYASAPPAPLPPPTELFRLNIEEPEDGGTAAGISNLRGWALAASGIERLELFVDGAFVSEIPYGGIRSDVERAYPEVQDSLNSGFGQTINFNNMGSGQHSVTIRAISRDGELLEQQSSFIVEAITQTFLPPEEAPDLTGATVSIASTDEITVRGLTLADGSERDLVLKWSPARQDFVTTRAIHLGDIVRESEYNDLNSSATVFTAPARIVGNLSSLMDEDWFELSTDRNNRMIDVTFSSLPNNSPGNLGRWQVEWYGKQCPDKEGVTLSRRNLAINDEGFTYSVPACEQGVYRVAIRVPQSYSYFYDSGEYSLQISLSEWP